MKQFVRSVLLLSIVACLYGCASSSIPAIATNNKNALRVAKAIPKYHKLSRAEWARLRIKNSLSVGEHNKNVPIIRDRLITLGDMSKRYASNSTLFDENLQHSLAQFQWRHGLKPDGELGKKTLQALNVPPSQRLRQLQLNMQRWAKVPDHVGSHYIKVNIPSYRLDIIKDGKSVMDMRVVVGKPKRPTPTLYSKVQTLVFNPKWNVPTLIANKDIVPKVLEDENYLAENDIKILSSWEKDAYTIDPKEIDWEKAKENGFQYRFSQAPGDLNALGRVKFIFLNKHDVYLHDTPQKGLFNKIQRAFSSGCIRAEKPFQLVEYFIKDDSQIDQEKVVDYLNNKKMKYVRMKNPVPIYVTYITAWVDKDGMTHFREDIYKKDV